MAKKEKKPKALTQVQRNGIDHAKYMWTSLERCNTNLATMIHHHGSGSITEDDAHRLAIIAEQEMKADGTWVERGENGLKKPKA